MASNKILNKSDRELLMGFAVKNIKCDDEKEALRKSYEIAKPFVMESVEKRFPANDMKIMEKYGASRKDEYIRFGGSYDNESTFRFDQDDKDIPLVPRHNKCYELSYDWSQEALKALNAYVLARQSYEKAIRNKKEDYRRLVIGSRTFNDIVEVWPAAEEMRAIIIPATPQQRALAVLSEETIARIKADNAGGA